MKKYKDFKEYMEDHYLDEIMEAISSLRSPFHGKPVLRDENNTPDNPFRSEGVIFDLRSKTPKPRETQTRT